MNKYKIVHITSSLCRGGAEHVLHSLVHGLQQSYEQTVIYMHDGPYRIDIERLGIPCIKVSGLLMQYDLLFFVRLYQVIKRINPDLIHTLLWAGTIAGRVIGSLLSIPVVSMYHGNVDQQGWLRNVCDRYTFSWSTINGAVSPGVAASVQVLVPDAQLPVIYNGIDASVIPVQHERDAINCTHDQYVIGAVGRLVSIKRFDLLINAFYSVQKKYAHARLCIIGVGPELSSLRELVIRYDMCDRVHFIVDVPAADYYHLFNCFVLPSPREGVSIALLEALRAGIPSIVIATEKHPVIEHAVNGIIVKRVDATMLAQAIENLILNKQQAAVLSYNGINTVKNCFNRDVMCAQYHKMFLSVIASSTAA